MYKKWIKPEIYTLTEEELNKIICAGACSMYSPGCSFFFIFQEGKNNV